MEFGIHREGEEIQFDQSVVVNIGSTGKGGGLSCHGYNRV